MPATSPAELVLAAFTVANALQVVSYVPQIVSVARDRNGASAIAYSTWLIWLAGSAATAAYAMVNIWDAWLAAVNTVHSVCCIAVIALTAWKRRRHKYFQARHAVEDGDPAGTFLRGATLLDASQRPGSNVHPSERRKPCRDSLQRSY